MPNISLSKRQLIIVGGGVALVVIIVVVIFLSMRPKANTSTQAKLTVWGTEDAVTFNDVLGTYAGAKITYTQIDPSNYQQSLLSALAAGTGPDVFEIGNRALPQWKSVLAPMPATLAAQFGPLQLSQTFPDVVGQDFVSGGQIYGLPLSIDTLVMAYNKDLFNSAGIAFPPKTWDDFDADIVKLRLLNAQGQIIQSAAAIGGLEASVPHAADLLALLMLQNGTTMTDAGLSTAAFASGGTSGGGTGLIAFNFYLQFASAASPYYTWSDTMGNAFDSFVAGKTAIVFAYQSDLATIKAKAPFLSIGIAPMPQPTGATVTINYPSYEGFVAAKAGQVAAAWNAILYLTTTEASAKMYVSETGKPPALRTVIQEYENDPAFSVFATQALTAKSWYEADDAKIDGILNAAIGNAESGASTPASALKQAEAAVTQLMH